MVTSVEGHLDPVDKEEEHIGSTAVSWRSSCPMLPIALLPCPNLTILGNLEHDELSTDGWTAVGRSSSFSLATVDQRPMTPMTAYLGRSWMNAGYWLQRTALGLALQAWATSRSGVKTFQLNSNHYFMGDRILSKSFYPFTPSICWMQTDAKGLTHTPEGARDERQQNVRGWAPGPWSLFRPNGMRH